MGVVCKTTESSGRSHSGSEMRLCTPKPGLLDDLRKRDTEGTADEREQSSA